MPARTTLHSDRSLSLALAVIDSSATPLVLLDDDFTLVAASRSFGRAFDVAAGEAEGRPFFSLRGGEWDDPRLRALLEETAAGNRQAEAFEMALLGARETPRQVVVQAQRLAYGNASPGRTVLSIFDVTDARSDARLRDELLQQKTVQLQEIQHRIANSLQIIASIIMLSARRAQSEDTRAHLGDAHSRVMSVATLQRRLAHSEVGEVALRPYLDELCESIGASMIRDRDQLQIVVTADESQVAGHVSISLGLVVTELVINCIKYAFPGGRRGRIAVDYRSEGGGWTLSVADDGVGMPLDAASATPGLGTSIVAALARQLGAALTNVAANPGVRISLVHERSNRAGLQAPSAP